MKQKWRAQTARFDALALRERALVAGAAVIGGGFLAYSLVIEPQYIRKEAQVKRIAKTNEDLAVVDAQTKNLKVQLKDPDIGNRNALLQTQKEMAELDAKLRGIESNMVPPEKMQAFLENLLAKNGKLELISLRTLPATPLIDRAADKKTDAKTETKTDGKSAAKTDASGAPNIYKHGVEIRIAGSYNDLLSYLAGLERIPQKVVWNRVALTAEKYPRSVMTLTVYTLSLDKQWLMV